MGPINKAVAPAHLDAEIRTVVNDLLAGEQHALAATKQLVTVVPSLTTDEAFTWTTELSASLSASDEAHEGMAAFLEKRPTS